MWRKQRFGMKSLQPTILFMKGLATAQQWVICTIDYKYATQTNAIYNYKKPQVIIF